MRKVLWSALFFLFGLSLFGQKIYQQPLKDVLTSTKVNTYIAVEGYYVDNSSFMVIHSSDNVIEVNTRYPVYEYKYQENIHSKGSNMAEVPVFAKKEIQGAQCTRILFLKKGRSSNRQLVIDESATIGMSIVGDSAKYIQSAEQRKVYTASLPALRDYLFNKGTMPKIEESISSFN